MGIYTADLQIENAALSRIKGRPITALANNTQEAIAISANWRLAISTVMRDHIWTDQLTQKNVNALTPKSFSTGARTDKYIDLAAAVEAAGTGDLTLFNATKPLAQISAVYVAGVEGEFRFKPQGTKLTSAMFPTAPFNITIDYIQVPIGAVTVDWANMNDPLLVEAYILALAQRINGAVTGNYALEQKLMAEYQMTISSARVRDGYEDKGMLPSEIAAIFNPEASPVAPRISSQGAQK